MTNCRVVLSGMRPTNDLTLGNLRGALAQFIQLQEGGKFDCLFFVADNHAQTTGVPVGTLEVMRMYLAAGLDPDRVTIYRQSDIPELHLFSWLLGSFAHHRDLLRMEQFREKGGGEVVVVSVDSLPKVEQDKIIAVDPDATEVEMTLPPPPGSQTRAALYWYPVLMAADILAFGTDFVPVGQDQNQHLEFARELARLINRHFSEELMVVPEGLVQPEAKVLSLSVKDLRPNGRMGKMSKSSPDGAVFLRDSADKVRKKFKKAHRTGGRTSGLEEPGNPDSCNIFTFHVQTGDDKLIKQVRRDCIAGNKSFGCGHCKASAAECVNTVLDPIRERLPAVDIMSEEELEAILARGADHVRGLIRPRLARLAELMGTPVPEWMR